MKGKRVLLVRAKVARDVIPRELRKAGATVDVVEAYETVAPKASERRLRAVLKSKRKPHAITFTSSSTVKNFVGLLGIAKRASGVEEDCANHGVHSASIGPVTSATLREFGLPVDIEAQRASTFLDLVAAIVLRITRSRERTSSATPAKVLPRRSRLRDAAMSRILDCHESLAISVRSTWQTHANRPWPATLS